jgi:hypothetical protein
MSVRHGHGIQRISGRGPPMKDWAKVSDWHNISITLTRPVSLAPSLCCPKTYRRLPLQTIETA